MLKLTFSLVKGKIEGRKKGVGVGVGGGDDLDL